MGLPEVSVAQGLRTVLDVHTAKIAAYVNNRKKPTIETQIILPELDDLGVIAECVAYIRKHDTMPIDSLAYLCCRDFNATATEFSTACKQYIDTIWGA